MGRDEPKIKPSFKILGEFLYTAGYHLEKTYPDGITIIGYTYSDGYGSFNFTLALRGHGNIPLLDQTQNRNGQFTLEKILQMMDNFHAYLKDKLIEIDHYKRGLEPQLARENIKLIDESTEEDDEE